MADVANRTQLPGVAGELTFTDLLGTRPRAKYFFKNYFIFWPCHMACGILVPQPGIKPAPPAVGVRSPNCWTTREVPKG